MTHIELFFLIIISFELLILFKFKSLIQKNLKLYKKFFYLFKLKKVSSAHKEKVILKYSINLFIKSIKIFLILTCVAIIFLIFIYFDKKFLDHVLSIFGLLESLTFLIIYRFLRKRIYAQL